MGEASLHGSRFIAEMQCQRHYLLGRACTSYRKPKSLDGWTEEKTTAFIEKDVESMHDDEDEKKGAAIEHQEIRA
jgi:hypothetical protein